MPAHGTSPRKLRDFIGLGRLLSWVRDRHDERIARKRRDELGKRGWLVSWHRDDSGHWRARLSGPKGVRTIERSAESRATAIDRAGVAMVRLLAYRTLYRPSPQARRTHADTSPAGPE